MRIACIKREGMGAGGSERILQFIAMALAKAGHEVDYFYSNVNVDPSRKEVMELSLVRLRPFCIASVIDDAHQTWSDTDFWDYFNESDYDVIHNSIYCSTEYPFHLLSKPVIEYINFGVDVNPANNVIHTLLPSQWLRKKWINKGGWISTSSVLPVPVGGASADFGLREELSIPKDAVVAGFHGRVCDYTYSDVPLAALARVKQANAYFVIMGLSQKYREQAKALSLDNIRFIEHSADSVRISSFLRTLDIFAHGRYDGETYGSVFAEALMHGLPCLSHHSEYDNAHQETMGKHGYFVRGIDEYAAKLTELFASQQLRDKLSSGAAEFAKREYSQEVTSRQLIRLYESLESRICVFNRSMQRRDSFFLRLYYRLFRIG